MSPPLPRYTTQPEPDWATITPHTDDELHTTSTYNPSTLSHFHRRPRATKNTAFIHVNPCASVVPPSLLPFAP